MTPFSEVCPSSPRWPRFSVNRDKRPTFVWPSEANNHELWIVRVFWEGPERAVIVNERHNSSSDLPVRRASKATYLIRQSDCYRVRLTLLSSSGMGCRTYVHCRSTPYYIYGKSLQDCLLTRAPTPLMPLFYLRHNVSWHAPTSNVSCG